MASSDGAWDLQWCAWQASTGSDKLTQPADQADRTGLPVAVSEPCSPGIFQCWLVPTNTKKKRKERSSHFLCYQHCYLVVAFAARILIKLNQKVELFFLDGQCTQHTHTQSDHSTFDKSAKHTQEMKEKHQLEIIDVKLIVLPPSSPISLLAAMTPSF